MGVSVDVELRWADLDAYGHVNNVAIVRLLEQARLRAFWFNGPLPPLEAGALLWWLVADVAVHYLAPFEFQDEPVQVEMSVPDVEAASFWIHYRILATGRTLVATGRSRIVAVDPATKRPVRIPANLRAALSA